MKRRINISNLMLAILVLLSFSIGIMTISVKAEEHIHNYEQKIVEPQCGIEGSFSNFCICGAGAERILPAYPHHFGEWEIIEEPTAERNGIQQKTCNTCGKNQQASYICPHKFSKWELTLKPTPTENGEETRICEKCNRKETRVYICPHDFSSWDLTTKPTPTKNGIETRICNICTLEETREFICTHEDTETTVIKKATCQNTGYIKINCSLCTVLIEEKETSKTDCNYSDWIYTKKATPIENGSKYKYCLTCEHKVTKETTFDRKSGNSIYIESAGINARFVFGDFTQSAVDNNDIVYNTSRLNRTNPIVLGHNYGSLGKLYKAKIGTYIYIMHSSGEVETYKITVSEHAREVDGGTDIKGYSTGTRLITYYDTKTLHLYTCYGNERWLVMAKKV